MSILVNVFSKCSMRSSKVLLGVATVTPPLLPIAADMASSSTPSVTKLFTRRSTMNCLPGNSPEESSTNTTVQTVVDVTGPPFKEHSRSSACKNSVKVPALSSTVGKRIFQQVLRVSCAASCTSLQGPSAEQDNPTKQSLRDDRRVDPEESPSLEGSTCSLMAVCSWRQACHNK